MRSPVVVFDVDDTFRAGASTFPRERLVRGGDSKAVGCNISFIIETVETLCCGMTAGVARTGRSVDFYLHGSERPTKSSRAMLKACRECGQQRRRYHRGRDDRLARKFYRTYVIEPPRMRSDTC